MFEPSEFACEAYASSEASTGNIHCHRLKATQDLSVAAYPSTVRYVNKTVTATSKVQSRLEDGNPAPGKSHSSSPFPQAYK
jgi:hypothetical protein